MTHCIDNRETFKMTHDSRSFVSFDKSQYTTNEHTYMMWESKNGHEMNMKYHRVIKYNYLDGFV